MTRSLIIVALLLTTACANRQSAGNKSTTRGSTTTPPTLDQRTYRLTTMASDPGYGRSPERPVLVGGISDQSGPQNERMFLNALLGPRGEATTYSRYGSCCSFKTPNGLINGIGLLDHFWITWEGSTDTVSLYLNMYDAGDLFIPAGFTARQ